MDIWYLISKNVDECQKEGKRMLSPKESPLKGKTVLIVDDEPDVLDAIADCLDSCIIDKAQDRNTAMEYLASCTYDVVILDIMGVNGFDILQETVEKGFPTVILTAHALNAETLKKSMKLGAVVFLPKEKMTELRPFLEEVILSGGKPVWKKFFHKLEDYFSRRFGPDWIEQDRFFREFKEEVLKQEAGDDADSRKS
jgi:CheY-like chemotaxis protein